MFKLGNGSGVCNLEIGKVKESKTDEVNGASTKAVYMQVWSFSRGSEWAKIWSRGNQ